MRINELPKWAVPVAVGVGAFSAGVGAGVLFMRRRYQKVVDVTTVLEDSQLSFTFEDTEFDREINKATYTIRKLRDETENIVSAIKDIAILQGIPVTNSRDKHPSNERPRPEHIVVAPKEESRGEVVHIFQERDDDDDWDYEIELNNRSKLAPYIIHRDEYFNDELGYGKAGDQRTFTWYAGDRILTDEQDTPIYNAQERAGELRFGHGSGDPNIVYVRNEAEQEEYEIILDDGSYEVVVMGGDIENTMEQEDIRHSRSPGKFRRDD